MSRILGSLDNHSRIKESTALMEPDRFETDQLQVGDFIIRALHAFRNSVRSLRFFTVKEKV